MYNYNCNLFVGCSWCDEGIYQLWSVCVWVCVSPHGDFVDNPRWSAGTSDYSAIYHPGNVLPLLSPGIKQSPKQINRRPAVVMGAATEPAAHSQLQWLPLQQKSRRWFWPGSFVGVHMGPWLKQFKSPRGSGGPPLPMTAALPAAFPWRASGNRGDRSVSVILSRWKNITSTHFIYKTNV